MPSWFIYRQIIRTYSGSAELAIDAICYRFLGPALLRSLTVDCMVSGSLFLRPCCLGCCHIAINPFQQIA
jgi:hypothetical protein